MAYFVINNNYTVTKVEKILVNEIQSGFNKYITRTHFYDIGNRVKFIIDGDNYNDTITLFKHMVETLQTDLSTFYG